MVFYVANLNKLVIDQNPKNILTFKKKVKHISYKKNWYSKKISNHVAILAKKTNGLINFKKKL